MDDFERLMLPHLDAAFALAVWLTRDHAAAQDIVQESYLRAFKAWRRFEAGNAKAWLLTIVRRRAMTWLKRRRSDVDLDDDMADTSGDVGALSHDATQEAVVIAQQDVAAVRAAIGALAVQWREIIVLKDIEGLAYTDIARVLEIPLGTVMSRLSRARDKLKERLIRDGYANGS